MFVVLFNVFISVELPAGVVMMVEVLLVTVDEPFVTADVVVAVIGNALVEVVVVMEFNGVVMREVAAVIGTEDAVLVAV